VASCSKILCPLIIVCHSNKKLAPCAICAIVSVFIWLKQSLSPLCIVISLYNVDLKLHYFVLLPFPVFISCGKCKTVSHNFKAANLHVCLLASYHITYQYGNLYQFTIYLNFINPTCLCSLSVLWTRLTYDCCLLSPRQ
jgi:hypothetical protein